MNNAISMNVIWCHITWEYDHVWWADKDLEDDCNLFQGSVLSQRLPRGTDETHENLSKDSC
jgi:hypothetical protein